jgi:hypothetical protein
MYQNKITCYDILVYQPKIKSKIRYIQILLVKFKNINVILIKICNCEIFTS